MNLSVYSAHQTHYEQMGSLNGTLSINEEQFDINMQAFRDHSFGSQISITIIK